MELSGENSKYEQELHKSKREQGVAESEFGIAQSKLGTKREHGVEEFGTTRRQQNEASQKALAQLAESYKKLGNRQEESANQAGVIQGGTLLQSAMKRAGNEGLTKQTDEHALKEQLAGDALKEQRFKEGVEESEGSNTLNHQRELGGVDAAGNPFQGTFGEAQTNLRENARKFEENIETVKGTEAAEKYGYVAPGSNLPPIVQQRAAKVRAEAARAAKAGTSGGHTVVAHPPVRRPASWQQAAQKIGSGFKVPAPADYLVKAKAKARL